MSPKSSAGVERSATCPACPTCGGTEFEVQGFLGYCQPFDAKQDEYSDFDIDGNCDFPTGAFCAQCRTDVTRVFRQHNVLVFYKVVPEGDRSTGADEDCAGCATDEDAAT